MYVDENIITKQGAFSNINCCILTKYNPKTAHIFLV